MASEEILKFLSDQNRPFSASDIAQNVSKEHTKSSIQKAIDKLVIQNVIFEKAYGKQKIYCITQSSVNLNTMDEELKKMDRSINEIEMNLKEAEEALQTKTAELKRLSTQMTLDEAKSVKSDLMNEVSQLKEKLEGLGNGKVQISEKEKLKVYSLHEKYTKEYKKRKKLCNEIINTIMEGYPKSKKDLIESVGIETDEDVGFVLKEVV